MIHRARISLATGKVRTRTRDSFAVTALIGPGSSTSNSGWYYPTEARCVGSVWRCRANVGRVQHEYALPLMTGRKVPWPVVRGILETITNSFFECSSSNGFAVDLANQTLPRKRRTYKAGALHVLLPSVSPPLDNLARLSATIMPGLTIITRFQPNS